MVKQIRWIFHENPVRLWSVVFASGFFSILFTVLIEIMLARAQSVQVRRESGEVAVVNGQMGTIPIDQKRIRAECAGGRTKRRFRHYPEGVTPAYGVHWDGAFDLLDEQSADDEPGDFKFPLYVKLPFEHLPPYPSGHWFLDGKVIDNCGLFSSILSLFSAQPIQLPPVPVKVIGK